MQQSDEQNLDHFISVREVDKGEPHLTISDLSLYLPKERRTLVEEFNIALKKGDRLILTGPSGSGKSTIMRAIGQLCSKNGNGDIETPLKKDMLFLCQDTHIPNGSLHEIFNSQSRDHVYNYEEIDDVLQKIGGLQKIRYQLPINQAKPEVLSKAAQPYLEMSVTHLSRRLARLNDKEKEMVLEGMKAYIEENAENFFPEELHPHMDKKNKKEFAALVSEQVKKPLLETKFETKGILPFFGGNVKSLSRDLARLVMQASAMELKYFTKNGAQLNQELSGGEEQKIAIAQALLIKPPLLIMDEPTSRMDPSSSQHCMKLIMEEMPDSIVVCIGHDEKLIPHFTLHGHLDNKKINLLPIEP